MPEKGWYITGAKNQAKRDQTAAARTLKEDGSRIFKRNELRKDLQQATRV